MKISYLAPWMGMESSLPQIQKFSDQEAWEQQWYPSLQEGEEEAMNKILMEILNKNPDSLNHGIILSEKDTYKILDSSSLLRLNSLLYNNLIDDIDRMNPSEKNDFNAKAMNFYLRMLLRPFLWSESAQADPETLERLKSFQLVKAFLAMVQLRHEFFHMIVKIAKNQKYHLENDFDKSLEIFNQYIQSLDNNKDLKLLNYLITRTMPEKDRAFFLNFDDFIYFFTKENIRNIMYLSAAKKENEFFQKLRKDIYSKDFNNKLKIYKQEIDKKIKENEERKENLYALFSLKNKMITEINDEKGPYFVKKGPHVVNMTYLIEPVSAQPTPDQDNGKELVIDICKKIINSDLLYIKLSEIYKKCGNNPFIISQVGAALEHESFPVDPDIDEQDTRKNQQIRFIYKDNFNELKS